MTRHKCFYGAQSDQRGPVWRGEPSAHGPCVI